MMTIVKCFSVLVASGNGQRCNELRKAVRESLLEVDEETDKFKVTIIKYGRQSMPKAHERVATDLARDIGHLFTDISDHYYSVDSGVSS